jgi:hypothetical protein
VADVLGPVCADPTAANIVAFHEVHASHLREIGNEQAAARADERAEHARHPAAARPDPSLRPPLGRATRARYALAGSQRGDAALRRAAAAHRRSQAADARAAASALRSPLDERRGRADERDRGADERERFAAALAAARTSTSGR